ncbi:GNAT family N-acetyltransferase [Cellulomonas fimi]|uniref:GCN5-related N-acetyltransferase n=1 Tax=Cellulomonas fimi (strain ATCC 484 / DSM 20113 / JCM 1341 / CCUG 24087 / LMG 16345 / NBRC 15513 / NCIMB 8980 / NCTC 7547 / NRS-133) TaxID=590998 RepID=F4H711_CELFA|nr:GNAT family N-acetyltransferase [Cellulomonas fimi]AEE44520.1 GCN5-related N-acetyltransferase [Cellulomonas fimi ATCC 484]NNH06504.1 GNAT family N-acetyltransferase [Cellulomonas fimi]VEH26525.1 Predicted acetyltransferase [Cellulomonas fimi]
MVRPAVVLRRPEPADERAVRAAQAELEADGVDFAPGLAGSGWDGWLAMMRDRETGRALPVGIVPETFVLALVDGVVAGRGSVRHRLTPQLEVVGGHVGYAVRPAFRRQGVATVILRGCLDVLRGLGVDVAVLTCADGNVASARTVEAAGGVLRDVVVDPQGRPTRRYDVPVPG